MINKTTPLAIIAIAGSTLFSACASLPDSTLQYYLPKSEVSLGAITTVTCNEGGDIISVTSPVISARSMTDYKQARKLDLSKLNGTLSSTNISVDWYEDGRLKGINSTVTGSGKDVIESAVKLFSTVSGSGLSSEFAPPSACQLIRAEKTKTISFEYKVKGKLLPPHKNSTTHNLLLTADSMRQREKFNLSSNEVVDTISAETHISAFSLVETTDSAKAAKSKTGIPVVLRAPIRMTLRLLNVGGVDSAPETAKTIAGEKEAYVYIPKAALFGRKTFELALNENGSIAKIQYGTENGTALGLNSINSLVTALAGPSVTDQAAKFKAKGDLIEQQRRFLCLESGETNC